MIAKWQQVSDKVQNLNLFCELDILCDCGEKIVISSGARYKDCITQAMGRLWNDICDEDDFVAIAPKWLQLAAQTRIDSNVLGYIDDRKNQEYRNRLLSLVVSAIRTDSRYVSGEIEHRKTINTLRFDNAHNLTMVTEHKEVYSFKNTEP